MSNDLKEDDDDDDDNDVEDEDDDEFFKHKHVIYLNIVICNHRWYSIINISKI